LVQGGGTCFGLLPPIAAYRLLRRRCIISRMTRHTAWFSLKIPSAEGFATGEKVKSTLHTLGDYKVCLEVYPCGHEQKPNAVSAFVRVAPAVECGTSWEVTAKYGIGIKKKLMLSEKTSSGTFTGRAPSWGWSEIAKHAPTPGQSLRSRGLLSEDGELEVQAWIEGDFAPAQVASIQEFKNWLSGEALCRMWREGKFTDLTIAVDGSIFSCHRSILALASPVLDRMLSSSMQEGTLHSITMQDVTPEAVRVFLQFIYTGLLPKSGPKRAVVSTILSALELADMYELPALADACADTLVELCDVANILDGVQGLNLHRKASPNIEPALTRLLKKVRDDEEMLLALLLQKSCPQSVTIHTAVLTASLGVQTLETQAPNSVPSSDNAEQQINIGDILGPRVGEQTPPAQEDTVAAVDEEGAGSSHPAEITGSGLPPLAECSEHPSCSQPALQLTEASLQGGQQVPPIYASHHKLLADEELALAVELDQYSALQDSLQMTSTVAVSTAVQALDAPAHINEEEAALIQQERWASAVEARITGTSVATCPDGSEDAERVLEDTVANDADRGLECVMLCFNRHPKEFSDVLLNSEWVRGLVTRGVDVQPAWARGAKVLVAGLTEELVEEVGVAISDLRPWHVFISELDEPQMHSALSNLKYSIRPRVRPGASRHFTMNPQRPSAAEDIDGIEAAVQAEDNHSFEEGPEETPQAELETTQHAGDAKPPEENCIVYRTFIHFPVPKAISPRSAYTRSSTDRHEIEHPARAANPRKWGQQ